MNIAGKIACRTVGALGMSAGLYDACKIAGHYARVGKEDAQATYLDRVYFSSRTTDNVSFFSNGMREKVFDVRSKLGLPAIIGNIKGAIYGFLYGLGNWLPAIICSGFALASKGKMAKVGSIGVGLCAVADALYNGFGLGKHNIKN